MKILEIVSAEQQMGLLRVIFDNTWKALEQQAEQQRRIQAKPKPKPKAKPRAVKQAKSVARPMPAFKPVPLPPSPTSKPNNTAKSSQTPALGPNSTGYTNPNVAKKTSDSSYKTRGFGNANSVQRSDLDDSDRHS